MPFQDSRDFAASEDRADPLAKWRDEFDFPDQRNGRPPVYLCGNSLGLRSHRATRQIEEELASWKARAVEGHFHGQRPWLRYHRLAVPGFAELTGSLPAEVTAMNTLTVNLHLLMASFYRPTPERHAILIEATAFPSDRYAAESQLRLHGYDPDGGLLEWRPRDADGRLELEDLERLLERDGSRIALLLLPGVQYYNGQVLDLATICELGRRHGCRVGLDLAHAVGNVPLSLHDWAPDFAAWCSYKYLNGGPGAIAGAFVHERHFSAPRVERLHGWWGNDEATRFAMADEFDPAAGADAWQMSNPPIFALAPVVASLEIFREAGLPALVEKSGRLTGYLAWLIERRFAGRIESITPEALRGCQLSLKVRDPALDARRLFDDLCGLNVIGDWREPDVIRVAPAPLYNRFEDVFEFAERLREAVSAQGS